MSGSHWHDDRTEIDYSRRRGRGDEYRGAPRERDSYRGTRDRERSPPRGAAASRGAPPGCRLFVGNLAYRLHWKELKDHMRQAGDVQFVRIMEGHDGRSKGCGIVEYGNARDAERAMRELHDSYLQGRPIFVREDREPDDRVDHRSDKVERGDGSHKEPRGDREPSGHRREGRRGRGRRDEDKEPLSAEKLDEDLDSYFKDKPVTKAAAAAAADEDVAVDELEEELGLEN